MNLNHATTITVINTSSDVNLQLQQHVPEVARWFDQGSVERHDEADFLFLVHDCCDVLYTTSVVMLQLCF